jgi:hypothetical protein
MARAVLERALPMTTKAPRPWPSAWTAAAGAALARQLQAEVPHAALNRPLATTGAPRPRPWPWLGGTAARQFPLLQQAIHGQPLAYLDNAATTANPAGGAAGHAGDLKAGTAPTSTVACTP